MALLDELLIRIVADSSGVDRNIDESKKKTDGLTSSLGDAEEQTNSTGAALASFATKALAALTAALSVGNAISGAVNRAQMIGDLSRTSEALGIAIGDLDAFGKAAERAGGDAQGARDSLTDMAEALGEALSDKESGRAKAFQALGVSITDTNGKAKDGLTGILDLAGAVEKLDKSAAVFKIKELGITDNRTVELILKGRKELERLLAAQKAQGVVTKESAERAKAFNEGLYALRGATSSAANGFFDAIIPALTKVIEWLTKVVEWATEHKDVIVGFFIAIAGIVAAVYLPAMIAAAAATLAATWPLLAIIATIGLVAAAFALVYEDVMNFIDGNDSLIGQIFEKYPMIKDVVMAIVDVFSLLGAVAAQIWQSLITGFQQVIDFVMAGVSQIASGIGTVAGYFGIGSDEEQAGPKEPQGRARASGSGQDASDIPGNDTVLPPGSSINATMGEANRQIGAASASPLNGVSSNAITNSTQTKNTTVEIGQVTVNSQATDAQGVAKDMNSELSSQLKNLEHESATGVAR